MTAWFRDVIHCLGGDAVLAKLAGPGLVSLAIKIASAALSYIMLVAFARMMTVQDYGYFGLMMNASIVLSTACMLGLHTGALRFWPSHMERAEPALAKGFALSAQRVLVWVAVAVTLSGIAISSTGATAGWLGTAIGALLVAVYAAVLAFNEFYASLLRAQNHTSWALLPRDIVWRIASPAAAAYLLLHTGTLSAADAIGVCVGVLALLTLGQWFVSHRATRQLTGEVAAQTDWTSWRKILWPLAGSSLLFAFVQQLDVVVVGGLVGPTEAGSYFAAQKTASLLGLVMIAGGMVAAPLMSAAFQGGRTAELQKICKLLSLAIAATTLVGLGLLGLIGDELLALFDPSYRSAHGLLMVLALGYAFDALAGPTAYLMQMTKLENDYLKVMAMSYCIILALQLALVPRFGPMAAAIATTLGFLIWNCVAIALLRRDVGVDSSILSFLLPAKPKP